MIRPAFLSLVICLAGASCQSPSETRTDGYGVTWQRQLGVIQYYGDGEFLSFPERGTRGQPLAIEVRTYGGGCSAQGDTYSTVTGLNALIEPFDSFAVKLPPNTACDDMLRLYRHSATLTFNQSGLASVTVRGRRQPRGEIVAITRTITID